MFDFKNLYVIKVTMCLCVAYFVVMMYLLLVKSLVIATQVKCDTFTCKSSYVVNENAYKRFLRKFTIFEPWW